MGESNQPPIEQVLDGLDEVSERFGDEILANGLTVKQNNQAVLAMIAALTEKAAERGVTARGARVERVPVAPRVAHERATKQP